MNQRLLDPETVTTSVDSLAPIMVGSRTTVVQRMANAKHSITLGPRSDIVLFLRSSQEIGGWG